MVDKTNSTWIRNFIHNKSIEGTGYAIRNKCFFAEHAFKHACSIDLRLVKVLVNYIPSDRHFYYIKEGMNGALSNNNLDMNGALSNGTLDIIEFLLPKFGDKLAIQYQINYLAVWFARHNWDLKWLMDRGYRWTLDGINQYINNPEYYPTLQYYQVAHVRHFAVCKINYY